MGFDNFEIPAHDRLLRRCLVIVSEASLYHIETVSKILIQSDEDPSSAEIYYYRYSLSIYILRLHTASLT
jgi:hypothetical protein